MVAKNNNPFIMRRFLTTTGNSLKFQRKLAVAVKRARQIALLPYIGDNLK